MTNLLDNSLPVEKELELGEDEEVEETSNCKETALCTDPGCVKCFAWSVAGTVHGPEFPLLNGFDPRTVPKISKKEYEYRCFTCDHLSMVKTSDVFVPEKQWCVYCRTRSWVLCEDVMDTCEWCTQRCLANFLPKRRVVLVEGDPNAIRCVDSKVRVFNCHECGHDFESTAKKVCDQSISCRFCINRGALCTAEACVQCEERSCLKSKHYDHFVFTDEEKGGRMVRMNSTKEREFCCPKHKTVYTSSPARIETTMIPCPNCRHPTTALCVHKFLLTHGFPDAAREVRFEWARSNITGRPFVYDIVLPNEKVIVEVDGFHHFREGYYVKGNIVNETNPEERRELDVAKDVRAREKGYRVVRICQESICGRKDWDEDFVQDSHVEALTMIHGRCEEEDILPMYLNGHEMWDWRTRLLEALGATDQVSYLSKNPVLYDEHKKMFEASI